MSSRPQVLVTGPLGRTDEYCEAAHTAEWKAKSLELIATYPRALDTTSLPECFAAICVTSKQAIAALRKLPASHRSTPVACVGEVTAKLVRELGFSVLGSPAPNAKSLAEFLIGELAAEDELLWPRGSLSDELAVELRASGLRVHDPVVYETLQSPESKRAKDLRGLDAIFFASPSAVTVFGELSHPEEALRSIAAIAIGSTTDAALRESSLEFSRLVTLPKPTAAEFAIQLAGIRGPH